MNKEEKRKNNNNNNGEELDPLNSLSPKLNKKEDNYGSPSPTDFTQGNNS